MEAPISSKIRILTPPLDQSVCRPRGSAGSSVGILTFRHPAQNSPNALNNMVFKSKSLKHTSPSSLRVTA